jgi:hypothetical protein
MSEILVIVLDMDPRWFNTVDRVRSVVDIVSFYVSAVGNSIPPPGSLSLSVITAFPSRARTLFTGDWTRIKELSDTLSEAIKAEPAVHFETPISQALSHALSYVKKHSAGIPGRVVLFDCSMDPTDLATQSIPLSNVGWAAAGTDTGVPLARLNVVSLASETPSSALISLVPKTGGVQITHNYTTSHGELLEAIMFHLTVPEELRGIVKTRPGSDKTHMGAVCVCHNQPITRGYVCSTCLSVYCTDKCAICPVCGARIRREAKEEQSMSNQLFSKLFTTM